MDVVVEIETVAAEVGLLVRELIARALSLLLQTYRRVLSEVQSFQTADLQLE